MPVSPGAANNLAALQPNTRMLRRRLGASRRQAYWGSRDPVPDPQCLLPKHNQTNSTHTFWSSLVSVSCSIVLFVRTSSEQSFSQDQVYRIRVWFRDRIPASGELSLPPSSSPATTLPTVSREVSEQAVTDPVSRAGPATFLLRTKRRGASNTELGGNRLRTFLAVRLLFAMFKTRSRAKSFMLKTRTNNG